MSFSATAVATRRHDLDWVRIGAFLLLVPYHVGMYYVTWDWHIKSPVVSHALEPLMILSAPWRLALLFLISGVATAFMLQRVEQGFLRKRSARLLLPLLFGMLVIVAPQSYFEVREKLPGGYAESYLTFWGRYLAGDGSFCRDGDCLALPTWNHLWFVVYLWVYTTLLVGWRALRLDRASRWVRARLQGASPWRVLLWPALAFVLFRLLLFPAFDSSHALVDDFYNHAQYLLAFVLGYLAAQSTPVWDAVQRARWPAAWLSLAGAAFLFVYFSVYADSVPPAALLWFQRVVFATFGWSVIVTILGFASRIPFRDSAAKRYLTIAVFPFYILHQTLIILIAWWLRRFEMSPVLEGMVLIVATFAIGLVAFEIIRRIAGLRVLFGLRWKRQQFATERQPALALS